MFGCSLSIVWLSTSMAYLAAGKTDDAVRCQIGVTLTGIGRLEADYMHRGELGGQDYYGHFDSSTLRWTYLVRYDNASQNSYLAPADALRAAGQWTLVDGGRPDCGAHLNEKPCKLLAICSKGCPDIPATTSVTAPWPAAGHFHTEWEDEAGTAITPVSASASCCRRKPQECDACTAGTCGGLLNWLNCPASGFRAKHHPLERDCCEREWAVFNSVCTCKQPETLCDHRSEAVSDGMAVAV
eukprot:gnl/TRDRNA2_/TRDRNA2_28434_c0_seq1.p1 gnl/TRDRNA2_/TRDRNA2_28434_c0~~gnl/TRDRNA2_/TRDRNA2_28434_c0_seq1.p1  ORF type:complete len:241 (+),score=22.79 gnl/TRDRNA2_/TRDRNA2_28434_c0_seq1:81-803(+)